MNLVPKSGMILVRPIAAPVQASGLVTLADVYHEPETSGEVIALAERFVCPDCGACKAPQVEEGDYVIFPPSAGSQVELHGQTLLLLQESDVLAVVEPGTEVSV